MMGYIKKIMFVIGELNVCWILIVGGICVSVFISRFLFLIVYLGIVKKWMICIGFVFIFICNYIWYICGSSNVFVFINDKYCKYRCWCNCSCCFLF